MSTGGKPLKASCLHGSSRAMEGGIEENCKANNSNLRGGKVPKIYTLQGDPSGWLLALFDIKVKVLLWYKESVRDGAFPFMSPSRNNKPDGSPCTMARKACRTNLRKRHQEGKHGIHWLNLYV